MVSKSLLKLRKKIKHKKPDYFRPHWWRNIRVKRKKESWRYPKGKHNKIRRRWKGKPAMLEVGYGSPKEVKGLLPNGLKPVLVHNVEELMSLNPETDCAIIASSVGKKKRIVILEKAKELNITVWGYKDIDKALETLKQT